MKNSHSQDQKRKKRFTLSKEALERHLKFLEERDPSIIGQTCQMLSALKIILNKQEAFAFLYGLIDDMKHSDKYRFLSEEQWHDLSLDSIDKYLPKILKNRVWIYSIADHIISKLENSLQVEYRKRKGYDPLFIQDQQGKLVENPQIKPAEVHPEHLALLNEVFEIACLTEREKKIFRFKEATRFTENAIGGILGVSRATVKRDYANAKKKLDQAKSRIS